VQRWWWQAQDSNLLTGHLIRSALPDVPARDRGCTKPGCDAPAYHSQVHHVRGWTVTRRTDINDLTLACGPHNRLVEKGGFTTRKNARGDTEWLPPPHLDYGQRRPWTHH
jgi:hypothetical protein